MWAKFCALLLKLMGWTRDGEPVPESKAILLGVPHTSIWDVPISYLYYQAFGRQTPRCMVKKEMFVWPLSAILRFMGCFPVDRTNATSVVKSVISHIESEDEFVLAIAPEGTRKPVRRWKTGFHTIARATGIPVYMAYFNWGTKHVGIYKKIELTDDPKADMERIQQMYEELHLVGRNPKNYLTH